MTQNWQDTEIYEWFAKFIGWEAVYLHPGNRYICCSECDKPIWSNHVANIEIETPSGLTTSFAWNVCVNCFSQYLKVTELTPLADGMMDIIIKYNKLVESDASNEELLEFMKAIMDAFYEELKIIDEMFD